MPFLSLWIWVKCDEAGEKKTKNVCTFLSLNHFNAIYSCILSMWSFCNKPIHWKRRQPGPMRCIWKNYSFIHFGFDYISHLSRCLHNSIHQTKIFERVSEWLANRLRHAEHYEMPHTNFRIYFIQFFFFSFCICTSKRYGNDFSFLTNFHSMIYCVRCSVFSVQVEQFIFIIFILKCKAFEPIVCLKHE